MSQTHRSGAASLLVEMTRSLFERHCLKETVDEAEAGEWPERLWQEVVENGLPLALVPEDAQGIGLSWSEAALVWEMAGRFAAPLPLAETMAGERLCALAGLASDSTGEGVLALAGVDPSDELSVHEAGGGLRLEGACRHVGWARVADRWLVVFSRGGETAAALLDGPSTLTGVRVEPGSNLAGEPRDDIVFHGCAVTPDRVKTMPVTHREVVRWMALSRTSLTAGAMQRILELVVEHATGRVQFGRPIARFQAVQQQIALLAAEVAAVSVAATAASEALDSAAGGAPLAVAAAKSVAGEAVRRVASIAHQVHGAIGYTHEHSLHQLTRRLWSWRDEYSSELDWAREVGQKALQGGGHDLWALLLSTDLTASAEPKK